MPSSFHSIGTMTSALRAFQRELDVTGHNVANVNTPGYTRQTVDLAALDPTNFTQGRMFALGNGVSVTSVNRIRDMFLEARRNEVAGEQGRLQAQSDGLSRVESVVLEPGKDGISDAIGKFFDSWSALAGSPNQPSLRAQVLQAAQTLTDRLKSTYGQLQSLKDEQVARAGESVDRINELGANIASLNDTIRKEMAAGSTPNDLLDRRDQALRELSGLTEIKTQALSDGTFSIAIGKHTLVAGSDTTAMPKEPIDTVNGTIGTGDDAVQVRGGQLQGLFDAANSISGVQQRLDKLADAMRSGINAVHTTGTNPAGSTNVKFFADGSGVQGLALDAAVLGHPEAIAAGGTSAAGDGSIALALSKLRNTGSAALGGRSFGDDYADLVGQVGRESRSVTEALSTQTSLGEQIESQVQSISGVSMDDEMASMLRFQRSYQAAAKALSTFDSVFDDLLGLMR